MFSDRYFSFYGGHRDEIHSLVFSHDLDILLTGSIHGCIRLWNTVFDHLTVKIQEHKGRIRALAISDDNQYFASTANDCHVRLYQTRTSHLLYLLTGHTHVADCLQFSSDSQSLASGAWDCRTILWNVITGEQMHNFHHHTNAVQSIAFHPTSKIMATGSHDQTICLYRLDKSPIPAPDVLRGHFNNVRALVFSDLPYLASAGWDKTIFIWHVETMRVRNRLLGHTGWIQAMSCRHDDGSILASVDDETVYVWNILSGRCLQRLPILNDLSCSVRFLPDERGVLVGGAVYELLTQQSISTSERTRTKHVGEPITGETKQRHRSLKLPALHSQLTKKNSH